MIVADLLNIDLPWKQIIIGAVCALLAVLLVNGTWVAATRRRLEFRERHGWIARTSYLLFLVATVTLAATSFGSILRFGHMSGLGLLIHIMSAGAFVATLFIVATAFLPWGSERQQSAYVLEHRWWLARWSAWALVVASLVAAGTMLISMLPILDTTGLLQFAQLHRLAGLIVAAAAAIHAYAMVVTRLGWR
ncbi:MAG: hypothetical protein D6753_06720 [Planctomycetota bacterium]|nr:MAG: hypothetical protein D6753_06720 [Planctomycetota bacterium]